VEGGKTPLLTASGLEELGYSVAAYPVTLLSASVNAMEKVLLKLKEGSDHTGDLIPFSDMKDLVGFTHYYKEEDRYK
jgi:2-methylisocitrate lyase-like PEP mutase family enzyme